MKHWCRWACGLLLGLAAALRAQVLVPLEVNGPVTNRVNMVVLAEGYTAAQQGQFLRDATNLMANFIAAEPYSRS